MRPGGKRGGSSTPSVCVPALFCIGALLVLRGVAVVGVCVSFISTKQISGVTKLG